MKKLILFLLIQLSFLTTHFGQTETYGGIFEATTWTLANSPYIVTDDIIIFPAGNLTIEPGVEVRFHPDTWLEIRASFLHANGTDELPITFTSNIENPTNDEDWNGILVTSTLDDSVGVEMNHVVVENSDVGLRYTEGIGHRTISHAVFQNNNYGVYLLQQTGNSLGINDSEFINNNIGIWGPASVYNCLFLENIISFQGPQLSEVTGKGGEIIDCSFYNNYIGIAGWNYLGIKHLYMKNCDFISNGAGVAEGFGEISNCYFHKMEGVGIAMLSGEIKNCVFSENNLAIRTYEIIDSTISIHNNFFSNDTTAFHIDSSNVEIYENTICNSVNYAVVLDTDQPVDLNNNCWCTTDLEEIAVAIYDGNDNDTLGIASFEMLNPDCTVDYVFPGDANNDGFANVWDILPIGLAFEETGPIRPDAETIWTGQASEDWSTTLANNVNIKHTDCDGNGVIDFADRSVIELNYAKFHTSPTDYAPVVNHDDAFQLYLDMPDTLVIGELVEVDVLLSDEENPITDLYGIAFAIEGDEPFFEPNSFRLITTGSWLGDEGNMLEISRDFPYEGRIEIGLARHDQQAASGFGLIAKLEFVMSEDIIAAYLGNGDTGTSATPEELLLNAIKIEAINSDGINLLIENAEQEIIINDTREISEVISQAVTVSPNPASAHIFIEYGNLSVEKVTLLDATGQVMRHFENAITSMPLTSIPSGVYLLKIQTEAGIGMKKVVVKHGD